LHENYCQQQHTVSIIIPVMHHLDRRIMILDATANHYAQSYKMQVISNDCYLLLLL
jgi:hypothetical protein